MKIILLLLSININFCSFLNHVALPHSIFTFACTFYNHLQILNVKKVTDKTLDTYVLKSRNFEILDNICLFVFCECYHIPFGKKLFLYFSGHSGLLMQKRLCHRLNTVLCYVLKDLRRGCCNCTFSLINRLNQIESAILMSYCFVHSFREITLFPDV
jgi:hypothetical protein